MIKSILILTACLASLTCLAQKKAITEDGKEVILYDNGTWKLKESEEINAKIDTLVVNKPAGATFSLKGEKAKYKISFNPKKWLVKEGAKEEFEHTFALKGEDAYVIVIPERIEIPTETLKEVALTNARKAAPDIQIIKEQVRIVNGIPLKYMQMEGTLKGMKFTYFGYYYSNNKGTVQLLGFTASQLKDKYESEIESFLNGFEGIE